MMVENTKLACCQIEPVVGEKKSNVNKMLKFASEAKKNGAKIIVFPELSNSGYLFNSQQEAFNLSE